MSLLWTLVIITAVAIAYIAYRFGRFVERVKRG